jgi:hypothetical protein
VFNTARPQPGILVTVVILALILRFVLIEATVETSKQVIFDAFADGLVVHKAAAPDAKFV